MKVIGFANPLSRVMMVRQSPASTCFSPRSVKRVKVRAVIASISLISG